MTNVLKNFEEVLPAPLPAGGDAKCIAIDVAVLQ
jgi:hypothetical protein